MPRYNDCRVRHVFTYGTLMSSAIGDMGAAERALLKAFGVCLGEASIRGEMFDAGACPGVVRKDDATGLVHGELWRLPRHLPDLVEALDRYEGCAAQSPLPHPYERRRVRVRSRSGERLTAWVYLWVRSTDGLARIADGRWRGPSQARLLVDTVPAEVAAA
jgi:gamma-glutamylcyclotransferase (GGCT)/AIG2-like uncharacterized protein YtfP